MYENLYKADWEDSIPLTKDEIVDLCEIARLFAIKGYATYIINQFGYICLDERLIIYGGLLEKINTELMESVDELMSNEEEVLALISDIVHKYRYYFHSEMRLDPAKIVKVDLKEG